MSTDRFEHFDAAYVLGALSPTDRQQFEDHLTECPDCAAAVRELAGMPGLLATVDPADVEAPNDPLPETLLPRLMSDVRRARRRRTSVLMGGAAAAGAAVAVLAVGIAGGVGVGPDDQPAATSTQQTGARPPQKPMTALTSTPLQARVSVQDMAWGAQVRLTCSYATGGSTYGGKAPGPTYVLVVRNDDGDTQRVATWRALPGQTMTVTGASSWSAEAIASIQIRSADGAALLQRDI